MNLRIQDDDYQKIFACSSCGSKVQTYEIHYAQRMFVFQFHCSAFLAIPAELLHSIVDYFGTN